MGQRNTICTHQMLDLESDPGYSHLHPDHCILQGNILDYPSQNMHLSLSASGNVAGLSCHQFIGHNRSIYHGNQYNNTQSHHPGPNLDVGVVAQANFYHPCILPSPSPVPQNTASANHLPPFIDYQVVGVSVDEHSRSNHFSQSVRGSCKRKNTETIPGNFYHASGSASSSLSSTYLSQNSGQTHWEESYRSGTNLLDCTTFNPPNYQVSGTLPSIEGSFRSMRNRSSSISLPSEFAFVHHLNYLLPGNHMGQSFHPASNAWVAQVGNNISDGRCCNWNYSYTMLGLHGKHFIFWKLHDNQ